MKIEKRMSYMPHESGTKFYEIGVFKCADKDRYVVVRRWGKMNALHRGGDIKIETFGNANAAMRAHDKVWREKEGRGYTLTDSNHGMKSGVDLFEHDMLGHPLTVHYGSSTAHAVMNNLDIDESPDEKEKFDAESFGEMKPVAAPIPAELIRSSEWASW